MDRDFQKSDRETSERRENRNFNFRKNGNQNTRKYPSYHKQNISDNTQESTSSNNEELIQNVEAQSADVHGNSSRTKQWHENKTHWQKNNKEWYPNPRSWKPREGNLNNASKTQSRPKKYQNGNEIPPRFSQHYTADVTDRSNGCVVNGRYVRKDATDRNETKLNVDAPVFIPQSQVDKEKLTFNNSHTAKQHYSNRRKDFSDCQPTSARGEIVNYRTEETHYKQRAFHAKSKTYMPSGNKHIYSGDDFVKSLSSDSSYEKPFIDDKSRRKQNFVGRNPSSTNIYPVSKSKESTTQRERLESQLIKGDCECLVCCEPIRPRDYVWSCCNCYHVFHLRCIKKWARSPSAVVKDGGWRCPACQNVTATVPYDYYCFCGKCKDPEVNYHFTPHTCGEICGRRREDTQCVHRCNILCHPGPCPPCTATITKSCECGKTKKTVPCAKNEPLVCKSTCAKTLNCGMHACEAECHAGPCEPCAVILSQSCYCSKDHRDVVCDSSTTTETGYSCNMPCAKTLSCGNHVCYVNCHPGTCATCKLLPDIATSCPCGKTQLQFLYLEGKYAERTSCKDPIPLCDSKCGKILDCGPKDNHHTCGNQCHMGECAPCELTTMVKCRCGSTTKEMSCVDMLKIDRNFLCEKRCNRRKDCGRHKCLNHCCINLVHKCELVCGKKLSCGSHQCQETCHDGNCPTCWNVSFDELRCHCGEAVLYPPIHCGTKPPECNQPCVRSHPCEHKVQHPCHSEEACPPCTALTVKMCFGQHEKRPSVQCYLDGISCGRPCDRPLSCGRHKCRDVCHAGSCNKSDVKCPQPCTEVRACGHPCAIPCHDPPCPESICKTKVEVSCPCGRRNEVTSCSEDSSAYRLMSVSILASKIQDIKAGESVNIGDIFNKKGKTSRLQCNEECAALERNKRLAIALQIQNPDLSCKPGPPNYSEFLKEESKKNIKFVASVYDRCSELVQLAKQSKQKSRSFAFSPMNRDQRKVIHELAAFFGCETQSYDEEPVKNVVVTAFRDKSWLPFVSLLTVVERDMGIRRGPQPVTLQSAAKVPVQVSIPEKKEKVIDYFDYTEP